MEHRKHPHYARRTFGVSLWLVVGGLACLLLGMALRGTSLAPFEMLLNVAFCGSLIALAIHWFSHGETTACPECGRRLHADPERNRDEPLTFVCEDCQIEWDVQAPSDD